MIYKACKPVYIKDFLYHYNQISFYPKSLSYYFDTELYVIFYNFSITTILLEIFFFFACSITASVKSRPV